MVMFALEIRPTKVLEKEMEEITLSEEDGKWVHFSHNDQIVVKATIINHVAGRIFVDNGSSIDILYGEMFGKMALKADLLTPSPAQMYSLTGDVVMPNGIISLPLTISEHPKTKVIQPNWVVVPGSSAFNAVIGRSTLLELGEVTSVKFLTIKFLTKLSVGVTKRD